VSVFLIILQVRGIRTKAASYRYRREGSNSGIVSAAEFLLKSCENRKVYPPRNYGKIAVSGGFGLIISRK